MIGPAASRELLMTAIFPESILIHVFLMARRTTLPLMLPYSTVSFRWIKPSWNISIPESMLERVFCNASEMASAPIPDMVIVVNCDARPVNERITVTITRTAITRIANAISRITVGFVPAFFAPLLIMRVNAFFDQYCHDCTDGMPIISSRFEIIPGDSSPILVKCRRT